MFLLNDKSPHLFSLDLSEGWLNRNAYLHFWGEDESIFIMSNRLVNVSELLKSQSKIMVSF